MPTRRAAREQRVVGEREERTAQRREHRELVVGPLDRGERVAQRDHLLALVERAAADQHVRDAARLERAHVGPRHVVAEGWKRRNRRHTWRAATGTRSPRSSTVQPLSRTSQSTNAPTASGSDSSIFQSTTLP